MQFAGAGAATALFAWFHSSRPISPEAHSAHNHRHELAARS
jgi:HAMP domain-containing protein